MALKTSEKVGIAAIVVVAGYMALKEFGPSLGKAKLTIDTEPIKGGIYLNGDYQGVAPITLELDPGTYAVGFGDVEGWITPPDYYSTLVEGDTVTVVGTYQTVTQYFMLTVATYPEMNLTLYVDSFSGVTPVSFELEGEYYYSIGLTVPTGYLVDHWEDDMGAVVGTGLEVTVVLTKDTALVAFITEITPTKAMLTVDTEPIKAVITLTWPGHHSQAVPPITWELDPGTYVVSFTDVEGWTTPQSVEVTLESGDVTARMGTYQPADGLPFCCPVCPLCFATFSELMDHLIANHPEWWY